MFWYFLIPLIPTVFWIIYFYRRDETEKEPKKLVFYSIILGALSTAFVARAEFFFLNQLNLIGSLETATLLGFLGMMVVGLVEETSKFLTLRLSFFRSQYFNEISDGIIYGVGIGLGFAFVENIFYAIQFGLTTSIARALITPIFHAAAAATSGYFLAKSLGKDRYPLKYFGIILAATIHGSSNFLLVLTANTANITPLVLAALLNLVFIIWLLRIFQRVTRTKVLQKRQITVSPLAAVLVNLVPGFGYIYLNLWNLGFLYMISTTYLSLNAAVAELIGFPSSPLIGLLFLILIAILWAYSSFSVFKIAREKQK